MAQRDNLQQRLNRVWGANVRQMRKDHGWTLLSAAARIGIDPGNLSRIEGGRQGTTDLMRIRIATAFGVQVPVIWSYPDTIAKAAG